MKLFMLDTYEDCNWGFSGHSKKIKLFVLETYEDCN
jgi:hypothetical protein